MNMLSGITRAGTTIIMVTHSEIHAKRTDRVVDILDGRLVDISAMGIGLEVPILLQSGEVVAVETDANVTFGVVRYCRPSADGTFRVGAETYHVMPKERKRPARKRWLSTLLSVVERF
jgi:hypothetical protein